MVQSRVPHPRDAPADAPPPVPFLPQPEEKQRASAAFAQLQAAMGVLGITAEEQAAVWHVLAGIYHLGAAGACKGKGGLTPHFPAPLVGAWDQGWEAEQVPACWGLAGASHPGGVEARCSQEGGCTRALLARFGLGRCRARLRGGQERGRPVAACKQDGVCEASPSASSLGRRGAGDSLGTASGLCR